MIYRVCMTLLGTDALLMIVLCAGIGRALWRGDERSEYAGWGRLALAFCAAALLAMVAGLPGDTNAVLRVAMLITACLWLYGRTREAQ